MRYSDADVFALFILPHEGSAYTDDPDDPGGPTKFGITQQDLSDYIGRPVSPDEIARLSRDYAQAFYTERYIKTYAALDDLLRCNVIDTAVNCGHSRAVKLLQCACGAEIDGVFGRDTAHMAALAPPRWNEALCGIRVAYYSTLVDVRPRSQKYLGGWRVRALSFLRVAETALSPARAAASRSGQAMFGPTGKAYLP